MSANICGSEQEYQRETGLPLYLKQKYTQTKIIILSPLNLLWMLPSDALHMYNYYDDNHIL